MNLHEYLDRSAKNHPGRVAVCDASGKSIQYGELGALSDRLRDRLVALGVAPGDRVGIYLRKSADSVASIFGILKSGAAYVPVDPTAPATRNSYILDNCSVKVAIVEQRFEKALRDELAKLGRIPPLLIVPEVGGGAGLNACLDEEQKRAPAPVSTTREVPPANLAYILYTSGSTGKPKGVMLTHENAAAFVEWCAAVFEPRVEDRFSSHAPFHFDLSILDIYTPIRTGAALVLVSEELGKESVGLARFIAEQKITVWYSAPSILSLMAQFGKFASYDYSALRLVLFAGEVFPVVHLRSLVAQIPHPRYYNLYGPTETNVCNYHEIPRPVPAERTDPYPIGIVCEHLQGVIVDLDGKPVAKGTEGELCIRGANVMVGYWNLPEQTANGFLARADGERWYRTGDIVVEEAGGVMRYVGRRDRMVKKRGYRVELGEIESCLYQHPRVKEAAVVALPDTEAGVLVYAHLSIKDADRLSLIELKKFSADRLPLYMIPDRFVFHAALPKTSTDKVDYQTLKTMK